MTNNLMLNAVGDENGTPETERPNAKSICESTTQENGPSEKFCHKCGQTKPATEFFRRQLPRTGYQPQCKQCRKSAQRNKYKTDPEWRRHNIDRTIQYRKNNSEKAKQWNRKTYLKTRYGIGLVEFNDMIEQQNHRCAICQNIFTEDNDACVDHNHQTGKMRQLLCSFCNSGLGYFRDNPQILLRATTYLKEHGGAFTNCGAVFTYD